MNIRLSYDPAGLDARVVQALDELVAPLQNFFGKGVIEAESYATFVQPRCRYFLQAAQSVPNNTDTPVLWTSLNGINDVVASSIQYDNGSLFGGTFLPVTSTAYLIPPIPGQYLVIAGASFDPNATGRRDLWLQQRDETGGRFDIAAATSVHSNSAGAVTNLQVSALITVRPKVTYGPGVRLMVYQNSGGALSLGTGVNGTYMQMIKLS